MIVDDARSEVGELGVLRARYVKFASQQDDH